MGFDSPGMVLLSILVMIYFAACEMFFAVSEVGNRKWASSLTPQE